jgi:hypothetical protein
MDALNGQALTTTPLVIFDATPGGADSIAGGGLGACTVFSLSNRSASAGNVLVNVAGLHSPGNFFGIPPTGIPVPFRNAKLGISKVTIKSDSTAIADGGVEAKL